VAGVEPSALGNRKIADALFPLLMENDDESNSQRRRRRRKK